MILKFHKQNVADISDKSKSYLDRIVSTHVNEVDYGKERFRNN